jgi:23S rRNA pseudouridine1911/1915/1917 synthase
MSSSGKETVKLDAIVPGELDGQRLDQIAAQLFSDYSRSRLQQWIKSGELTVDGNIAKSRDSIFSGSHLKLDATLEQSERWEAQAISLDIIYEDNHLLVINKAAGLVVHPAAGHADGTLVNALLHHCPSLTTLPRAGIVHRLDKDTSGLLVVAKTLPAHNDLVSQLQERSVHREYEAIIYGTPTGGGTVNADMGRHPKDRLKMAVLTHGGKEAITHYRLIKRFAAHTHIRCLLETGRTHQIRVHMAHAGFPLVGDSLYTRLKLPAGASAELREALRNFPRQALHARRLELLHPASGELISWEVPLAQDMVDLLAILAEEDRSRDY